MNDFWQGCYYFFCGFSLIAKPGMKRYVIIPLWINFIVFIGLFFFIRHYIVELNAWISHYIPNWLSWLTLIIWVLFFISFLIIIIYCFSLLANIIAAPFNSFLAEKVAYFLTGKMLHSKSLYQLILDFPRIILRQLSILIYYLPRAIAVLLLFLIPVIQTIAIFVWFLLNAWNIALTYLDYPTDNEGISFNRLRSWVSHRKLLTLGFGISTLIALMIPGLNFLTIPAAVAGATKLWIDESHAKIK